MTIIDVNLLLNAYNRDFPHHAAARAWWENAVNDGVDLALAWVTILGFIRIMTNRQVLPNPMSVENAVATAESWLALPNISLVEPGPRHSKVIFTLLRDIGVAGNLTTDAHLAALAIEHQAQLASLDTDFARFPGLRWFDPLSSRKRR